MKITGIGLFAPLAALMISSGALAADVPEMVNTAAFERATSVWDGIYAGIGGAYSTSTTITETIPAVQGTLGFNKTFGHFLLGAEAYVTDNWSSLGGPAYWAVGAEGRAGVLISDPVLLYGAVGYEYEEGSNTFATFGGGVEFAVHPKVSVDLEYKYYQGLDNSWRGNSFSLSGNWHF